MILRRASIFQLANLMVAAMAIGLAGLVVIGAAVIAEIEEVAARWQKYEIEAITKLDALADLRIEVGVGSLIDNLHQYRLHRDEAHRGQLEESLRLARANLDAYRLTGGLSESEELALTQVTAVLDHLGEGIAADRLPPEESDQGELQDAALSLSSLDRMISESNSALSQSTLDGMARLRRVAVIGGGGAALLLAFVTFSVLWQSRRRVVAPLARLVADSRRLAALQLDAPFDWPHHDELGELGRTLDGARQTLRDLLAENEEKARRLVHQATHDSLTGLANRSKLIEWLNERLGSGQPSALALLFLDLDGFKMVNDSLGHSVGDKLLLAVAGRLASLAGPDERLVRLGGDQFVVLLDLAGGHGAKDSAAKLQQAFAAPFAVDGMELSITASIGIAIDDGHAKVGEDLLRDADIAVYRAKEKGRGHTHFFDIALREAVLMRHRLHSDLDQAAGNQEIFLVYQPIIRLQSGEITGFEALIRWRHPELGMVSPARFVPIAEESGAILKLGRHVLDSAARDLALLQEKAESRLTMNVNFSPRQMWDEHHVEEVLARLREPDCAQIKIEVTESLAMTNPDSARDILQRFSAIGVPLVIDDFGTGYSSLSYLGRFPFTMLKLDKSFIEGLAGSRPEQIRLVGGVIQLAHALGLDVVAEGIELERERAMLTGMGCDYGQGYLFAKPMILTDALVFLER